MDYEISRAVLESASDSVELTSRIDRFRSQFPSGHESRFIIRFCNWFDSIRVNDGARMTCDERAAIIYHGIHTLWHRFQLSHFHLNKYVKDMSGLGNEVKYWRWTLNNLDILGSVSSGATYNKSTVASMARNNPIEDTAAKRSKTVVRSTKPSASVASNPKGTISTKLVHLPSSCWLESRPNAVVSSRSDSSFKFPLKSVESGNFG